MQTNQQIRVFMPWLLITTLALGLSSIIGARAGEWFGFPLGDAVERALQGIGLPLSGGYVPSMVAGFVNGSVAGLIIGFLQWLILRSYVKRAVWWVLLTMLASAIASLIASGILSFFLNALGGTWFAFVVGFSVSGLVRGAVIGIPQWLVFAGRFENSFWWIILSIAAWTIGDVAFAFGYSLLMLLGEVDRVWEIILGAISGFSIGAITGLALVFILGHPHPTSELKEEETSYAHV